MAMRYYAPYPRGGARRQPWGTHVLRIGDAERDAAAADLGEHYVAGRLTLDELHQRLGAVFSARTYGQLTRVMSDLPGLRPQPPVTPRSWPAPARGVSPATDTGRGSLTPADRAGRYAALSLLLLAMLIWLVTALLFAHSGYYHHPMGPMGQFSQYAHQFGQVSPPGGP